MIKAYLITLFFVFIHAFAFLQHSVNWTNEIQVSNGSIYGNLRPRIAVPGDGNPVVLTGNNAGEVFVAKYNGSSFNTPVSIVPSGMESYNANWTGPAIAAHGNVVIAVFKANPFDFGNIYAVRSTDGGLTFSDTMRVDNHDVGRTFMPSITMDDAGNPFITYMIFDANDADPQIAVVRSTDGGVTYEPQVVSSSLAPGEACDCCPPEIVASGNYRLSLYRNNELNVRDTWGALSEDGGSTYNSVENLDNLNWVINTCPSTGPDAYIVGDSAYVVYASRASGKYRIYASSVGLQGGLNLTSVQMMDPPTSNPGDTQNFPRITGSGDTLVMVWEEKESNNTDVKVAVCVDGSISTLTSYKSIATILTTGTQSKPEIAYAYGKVHMVFQDFSSSSAYYRSGTVVDVTGTNELSQNPNVSVYPNPFSEVFYVEGDVKVLGISDALGRQVSYSERNLNGLMEITVSSKLTNGLYLVRLKDGNGNLLVRSLKLER